MDIADIIVRIRSYIESNHDTHDLFFYGSFVEYQEGYFVDPKDIDVVITHASNLEYGTTIEVNIEGVPLPVSINAMNTLDIIHEAHLIEPKYFHTIFNARAYSLHSSVTEAMSNKTRSDVRRAISNISSKAYNKGKKKLIIESDYDEYLGLKNIHHAFKFIIDAERYYSSHTFHSGDMELYKDKEKWELYELKKLIFTTYENSTGTLEERWKVLDSVMKPLYNKYMTEFRKIFPKEM